MSEKTQQMDVNFEGVEEAVSKGPLPLGVYDFTISGMEFKEGTGEKKTPYVNVILSTNDGNHMEKFYITAKALPRLKHMLLASGVAKEKLSQKLTSDSLAKMCIGKSFRAILGGREYEKDGKIYTARQFGYANFAAPIGDTSLKFDPAKHIERLSINPNLKIDTQLSMEAPTTTATDDFPF